MVRRILDGGHEVGLHGGRNHATWQRNACHWSRERVAAEVAWGKRRLEAAAGRDVTSFASPGWTSPDALAEILASDGFAVIADAREPCGVPGVLHTPSGSIASVPNTLAGEPGGVGYLENRRAAGLTDDAVLTEFDSLLAEERPYLCLYDHPFYAGRHAVALFERMLERILAREYEVVNCAQAGERALSTGAHAQS